MNGVLKVTTDNTLQKSLIKIPDLIEFLVVHNIKACGICDENLYGVLEFYKLCKEKGIKPLIGLTIYLENLEVYLYAMNNEGYKNLLKINTLKEKSLLNIDSLKDYKDNILVIVPFKSKELFKELSYFKNIYMGYKDSIERINAGALTSKLVSVKDIRCLYKEDVPYLKYLSALRGEEDTEGTYFEECIESEIFDLLNVEIDFSKKYIPKYNKDIDSYKYLRELSMRGLNKRLQGNVTDAYKKRLEYELSVIEKMGFVDYFLIVYDYCLYAKKKGIMVGPGRGSAAGSLVSFSIGITDIDPLKYDLLFERFLNPERVTMPDIDIDFDALRREEVIEYVRNKYGRENVALGLTFSTYKSKLVLRDLGKVLRINASLLDSFLKLIDASKSLEDNLSNGSIARYLNNYQELRNLYEIARKLEGLKKNTSIHAAGVIISSEELDNIIPVHYDNEVLITGVSLDYLESMGLLKMDFLALKNLTTITSILNNIGRNVLKDIDYNDPKVLSLFGSGKTEGIFQFETPLMKNLVRKIRPNSFDDLVAAIALGRPGPMSEVDNYVRRKEGEVVTYLDKSLEDILKSTYGIIIYQEQIMAILRIVGGYSYAEADLIRRAISKKKENVINEEESKFINRAIKRGYNENVAKNIYSLILKFASYGFNKSHSVAYSIISYQMAYLKVYYPEYFIIEMLNEKDDKKFGSSINYLKSKGIKLCKPDVNISKDKFYLENNYLIMPLGYIKGLNKNMEDKILSNRGEGYKDYFDFCYKNKDYLKEDILSILIKAGALRSFKVNMNTLLMNIESVLNYASLEDGSGLISKPVLVEYPEVNDEVLRAYELSSYGTFITNHPASKYPNAFKVAGIENNLFKNQVFIVLVDRISRIKTKKGEDMAFLTAGDETGSADFTVFPKEYEMLREIKEGNLVEIRGSISKRYDKISVIVNSVKKVF